MEEEDLAKFDLSAMLSWLENVPKRESLEMLIKMIEKIWKREWLESYHPTNREEAKDALREIMQEITLAGLNRAGFLKRRHFMEGLRSGYSTG